MAPDDRDAPCLGAQHPEPDDAPEIDLPNTGSQILPGMYAYGEVVVERPDVRALPKAAFTHAGGKTFIWRYEKGHAARTEVQTGVTDADWIQVTNRRVASKSSEDERWEPLLPTEQVLIGSKLSTLTDGGLVRVSDSPPPAGSESDNTKSNAMDAG